MAGQSESAKSRNGATGVARSTPGKFLTFKIGRETFGLQILVVQEIIGLLDFTRVPRMPSCVRGVVNLRGKIIPVVDMRLLLGVPVGEHREKNCIIVVHFEDREEETKVGLVVDEVCEVEDVFEEDTEAPPIIHGEAGETMISSVAKTAEGLVILLDARQLLREVEEATHETDSQENDAITADATCEEGQRPKE